MPGERFRHIFLPGPSSAMGFTNPRGGGSAPRIPQRQRQGHSSYLRQRLEEAWTEAEHRRAVSHAERHGVYLDFFSDPDFNLKLQSLEARRSGIRLLNVRKVPGADGEQTIATVFVPYNQRGFFLRKIHAYATEETRTGKPKNQALIDSISDIRASLLESFWQDSGELIPAERPVPIEVWLSTDDDTTIGEFDSLLQQLQLEKAPGLIKFPERAVQLVYSNREGIERLVEFSDDLAEFRAAKEVSNYYIELENQEQIELARDLLGRCIYASESEVTVCILDTGVNNGHILLETLLDDADLHTVIPDWGIEDQEGHGTMMAGTIAYGDLLLVLNSEDTVEVSYRLESSKIKPFGTENPKELWGYMTAQGLSLAEIQGPTRKRVACLAITSRDARDRGRPSSWSARIDELASGYEDENQRLIVVSAGNVDDPNDWRVYYDSNLTNEVHDPGQAWNALTVGASTEKVNIVDEMLADYSPLAPAGGLSPSSTTSTTWSQKWPIKPEVVFEGGNVARHSENLVIDADELKLLSTNNEPNVAQFRPFWATSAAAAQAARMAALIQVQYPEIWPETVRALIVHSAEWNDILLSQFLPNRPTKTDYLKLLRICGYGNPNLERALYCASNALTLVSEASLQPYDRRGNTYYTREMHIYDLPWPTEALMQLGEATVRMRVTLSYFIEPSPGEVGWENRYRYASHALRFELNGPNESQEEFLRRINRQARDENEAPGTTGPREKWLIGEARNVGSIHSDIWTGRAADLAQSNHIAIFPTVGWWRERSYLNRWDRQSRYSLIVSINTESQDVDIYTPVATQIGIRVPVTV